MQNGDVIEIEKDGYSVTDVSGIESPVEGSVQIKDIEINGQVEENILEVLVVTDADLFPLRKLGPTSTLRTVCEEVVDFGEEFQLTISKMKATMKKYNGYGLSAPQVNIPLRFFVFNTDASKEPTVIVNPKLMGCAEYVNSNEGCLSIPSVNEKIMRFKKITLEYQNEKGEFLKSDFEDIDAVCIQHELDHLIGVLFIDHLSKTKRDMLIKKFRKNMKKFERYYFKTK